MLDNILSKLKSIFRIPTYQEQLEKYIVSNNPTSIYDVEYLTAQFDKLKGNVI